MMRGSEQHTMSMYPYYVYEYRDPRNGEVFYVGKGCGDRIDATRNEAERSPDAEHEKIRRIRDIVKDGHQPVATIVGRFETEPEAFAVESVLIKWVYGFDSLTNRIHGHRHTSVRPATEKEGLNFSHIEGIDRARGPRFLRTGDYTEKQREQIVANHVEEKLESLSALLGEVFSPPNSVSGPLLDRPQDPRVEVSAPGPSAAKIVVKVQLSGNEIKVLFGPTAGTGKGHEAFEAWHAAIDASSRTSIGDVKRGGPGGRYASFLSRISIDDTSGLIDGVVRALSFLAPIEAR